MDSLTLTSCQAPNAHYLCRGIARYLAQKLERPMRFIGDDDLPWRERKRQLEAGEIEIGWICGLPYVVHADGPAPVWELLAAPVMAGARYEGRPVYFSDVVVRRDSRFQSFEDLRGARWAINEPSSQSGCGVVRYHLATLGETRGFFGNVIESGAHQISLRMIRAGKIDASAIDSTVLEQEFENDPALRSQVRVIGALGPSPIPPWVISNRLPSDIRQAARAVLLNMHADPEGQAVLAPGQWARFARVADHDYDRIREMARLAEPVAW